MVNHKFNIAETLRELKKYIIFMNLFRRELLRKITLFRVLKCISEGVHCLATASV